MMKYRDNCYALYPKGGRGVNFNENEYEHNNRLCKEIDGLVETPHGLVRVYATYYGKFYESSRLDIIKNGRIYYRYFERFLTRKTLVTKAKQFADEIYS